MYNRPTIDSLAMRQYGRLYASDSLVSCLSQCSTIACATTLKTVTSRLWRHIVTLRHQWCN